MTVIFLILKKKIREKMREETVWGDGKVLEIGNGILKTKKKMINM